METGLIILLYLLFLWVILEFSFIFFNITLYFKIVLRKDKDTFFRKVLIGQETPYTIVPMILGVVIVAIVIFLYIFAVIAQYQGHYSFLLIPIHLVMLSLILGLLANTNNITAIIYGCFIPPKYVIFSATHGYQFRPFVEMNVFWNEGSGFIAAYAKLLRRIWSILSIPITMGKFYILPFVMTLASVFSYFLSENNRWWLLLLAVVTLLIGVFNIVGFYARYSNKMPVDERLKW
ncbi:hypothetical protein J4208_05540 [Candidatus Woesearchaeota archaeon]|nr:hypothetical protein [Candidatus Woesearchaeota archaeon]